MEKHPIQLFISYAKEDEAHKEKLDKHLTALKKQSLITSFDVGEIKAGEVWNESIQQHLAEADIILLLLSSDALADDYIHDEQIQKALDRAKKKEAILIPILLRPVDYQGFPIEKYYPLPTNGRPITLWKNEDEAYGHIVTKIREVVENIHDYKSGNVNAFAPKLPSDLAEDLINDTIWVKNLKQVLKKYVAVNDKPSNIFQHYGWLIEAFLQKMSTSVGKKRDLRRLRKTGDL